MIDDTHHIIEYELVLKYPPVKGGSVDFTFGFYSGNNLINAPIKSWFQFLSFPMNNNRNYVLQIGYGVTTGQILHTYVRFKDETHLSWEGVEWKEIDIQYK